MEAVGGRLVDDAAAEMKPARRVRMASSCGVFVMGFMFCVSVLWLDLDLGTSDTGHTAKERTQHICPVQEVESCRC